MGSEHKAMVEAINNAIMDHDFKLSPFEIRFFNSITGQIERGIKLSDKQDAVLEEIWKKATGYAEPKTRSQGRRYWPRF